MVEVEVDGETKYKVVFELEATEETVEAAQQEEEEITRINNSLVLPVSSTQTTTTRVESSVFIPVSGQNFLQRSGRIRYTRRPRD